VRGALLVLIAVTALPSLSGFAQETCAEKSKREKNLFQRRASYVRSETRKIASSVPFSKRETDEIPMDQIRDLAISAYIFGFVSTLAPKENLKANWLKMTEKDLKDKMQNLSPRDSEFVNAWVSKVIGMMSRSIDLGYAEGSKPCPQD